jgi:hypothetical protein
VMCVTKVACCGVCVCYDYQCMHLGALLVHNMLLMRDLAGLDVLDLRP